MEEQVIYTNPARSEYGYSPTVAYNPELMRFVHGPLNDCMKAAWPGVKGLRYVENMVERLPDGRERHYRQAVIVAFENGYRKVANVEGDSEWGCIEDVMKCILR